MQAGQTIAKVAADDVRPWFAARGQLTCSEADPRETARAAGRLLDCPSSAVTCVNPVDPVFRRAGGRGDVALTERSFANAVILAGRREIVPDATLDPRFKDLLQVILFPKARFFAGFPLFGARGEVLGALTLVDYVPHEEPDAAVIAEVERLADVISIALMPVGGTA